MNSKDVIMVVSSSGRVTQLSGASDQVKARIKNGNNSPIKHQIFITFSNIAKTENDKYWEDLFLSGAKNSLPKSFKFDGKILQYKIKNKAQLLDLSNTNITPQDKYVMTKQFINKHSGLISEKDNIANQKLSPTPTGRE